jgi:DNA-directed RNA polymerase beta' subunit
MDTREIKEIVFGVFSADEIEKMSVCEVTSSKLCNSGDKNALFGTVYDPRLGTIDNSTLCITCNENLWVCPGHFGHIRFNEPIIHPLYYKQVLKFLRSFCHKCFQLLIKEEQIYLNNLNKTKGIRRFEKLLEKIEKIDVCIHCGETQPEIKFTTSDNAISLIYKDKDKEKVSINLPVDDIKKIFDNVSDESVRLLGFNPELLHPKNLIITVFPVIPIVARPYVYADGNICDDDLTIQLVEIIKANNHLAPVNDVPLSDTKKQKHLQSLKFRVSTYYNNSCVSPDTEIILWNGNVKKAKEIIVGDVLIGDDLERRKVLSVCSGYDFMFEISSKDSCEKYRVNGNHILTLKLEDDTENHFDEYGEWLKNYADNFEVSNATWRLVYFDDGQSMDEKFYPFKIVDIKLEEYLLLPPSFQKRLKGIKKRNLDDPDVLRNTDIFDFTVTPLDDLAPYNGFVLDGNSRFVLKNLIVTHNSGKAKHSTSSRSIKGIKERLTGKEGLIRTNLMGKRCDQTGRTVIGPDPTLKVGQLAIPVQMARNLSYPVQVTNFNYEYLMDLVNKERKVNYVLKNNGQVRINMENALFSRGTPLNHGDIIIKESGDEIVVTNGKQTLEEGDKLKRNGVLLENLRFPQTREFKLEIGDVCERHLQDGDIVLLNRQPTLHEGSMLAQEIVIKPGKTLRFNLSINKSFNADFDGDEMNIHVPASLESEAELRLLSASKFKIISAQSSKPNFCIVQDSLLGAYKMTSGIKTVREDQFFNISLSLEMTLEELHRKIQTIRQVFKEKGKKVQAYHGKGLISLVLPETLIYEKNNGVDTDEPVVRIYKGVLYEGTLDKSTLGSVHNSLIHVIHKNYGPDETTKFIDGIIYVTNNWLLISGFSVGLADCMVHGDDKVEEINSVISKCYIEAEGIKANTFNPAICEVKITGSLSKAKDMGLKIAKNALLEDNNFISTVKSGAKGDFFNIAQIIGLLGQQNIMGQRVIPTLNDGKRTLPHYPFENLSLGQQYESRGFIDTSFIKGLNPKQYYFHNMSGRGEYCYLLLYIFITKHI